MVPDDLTIETAAQRHCRQFTWDLCAESCDDAPTTSTTQPTIPSTTPPRTTPPTTPQPNTPTNRTNTEDPFDPDVSDNDRNSQNAGVDPTTPTVNVPLINAGSGAVSHCLNNI